jgi:hypothetical protein
MSTTLVRNQEKGNRVNGNVIVQDYQNPAYASTLNLVTGVNTEETIVNIALTGNLTLTLGTLNPMIGDICKFYYTGGNAVYSITYSTGFAATAREDVAVNGYLISIFEYNGTAWIKTSIGAGTDIQSPASAATLSVTTTQRTTKVIAGTLSAGMTVNAVVTDAQSGDLLYFAFNADGSGPYTVTFGTNFVSSGTISVAASKYGSAEFIYNGTVWVMINKSATV